VSLGLQADVYEATGIVVGPDSDEFAGVDQSTWNFQRWSTFVPASSR
jgi:hypothetical protein